MKKSSFNVTIHEKSKHYSFNFSEGSKFKKK